MTIQSKHWRPQLFKYFWYLLYVFKSDAKSRGRGNRVPYSSSSINIKMY